MHRILAGAIAPYFTPLLLALVCVLPPAASAAAKFAYVGEKNGERQIYVARTDGTGAHAATRGNRWHLYPALDAGGERLAFVEGYGELALQLVVKDLRTGAKEQWTPQRGRYLHPRFSGDGRWLAFTAPDGPKGISQIALLEVARLRKTAPRKRTAEGTVYDVAPEVIASEMPCSYPALSFDGSLVVFQRERKGGHKEIVSYSRTTKELRVLSDPTVTSVAPALSFDDERVAFSARIGGNWDIYFLHLAHPAERIRVTTAEESDFAPRFRLDGSLVYESRVDSRSQLFEIDAEEMEDQTFGERLLVGGPADYFSPTVSGLGGALEPFLYAPALVLWPTFETFLPRVPPRFSLR